MALRKTLLATAALLSASSVSASETNPGSSSLQFEGEHASYERVSEVLINAMICPHFGYSVDRTGLAEWTTDQARHLLVQTEGYEPNDVYRRLNRATRSHYDRVRTRYRGEFETLASFGVVGTQADVFYNPERFFMRYRERCATLANATDAGAYFAKTGAEPTRSEMIVRVREDFLLRKLPRQKVWRKRFDEQQREKTSPAYVSESG